MTAAALDIAPAGARFEPGDDGVGRIVIDRPTDTANAIGEAARCSRRSMPRATRGRVACCS